MRHGFKSGLAAVPLAAEVPFLDGFRLLLAGGGFADLVFAAMLGQLSVLAFGSRLGQALEWVIGPLRASTRVDVV